MKRTMRDLYIKFNLVEIAVIFGGAIICLYGSMFSFMDIRIFNPLRDLYIYITQWAFSQVQPGRVLVTHFSNPFDGEWIGNINLLVGCYTVTYIFLKCWIYIANKIFERIEKNIFISKFGKRKYDAYKKD